MPPKKEVMRLSRPKPLRVFICPLESRCNGPEFVALGDLSFRVRWMLRARNDKSCNGRETRESCRRLTTPASSPMMKLHERFHGTGNYLRGGRHGPFQNNSSGTRNPTWQNSGFPHSNFGHLANGVAGHLGGFYRGSGAFLTS